MGAAHTMLGSKVIEALDKLHAPGPAWPSEAELQAAIEAELRRLGVAFLRRPSVPGRRPELVVETTPNLLLVISLSGETEKVSRAAAQLSRRTKTMPLARPVAVLGSAPRSVALRRALTQLGIILVECV